MTSGRTAYAWDDALKARLTELWNEGLTSGQIQAVMGLNSRGSVCGMARRLNLPMRPHNTNAKPKQPRPKVDRVVRVKTNRGLGMFSTSTPVAPDHRRLISNAWEALPGIPPVPLVDLEHGMCRWPIGDGKPFLFCGASADGTYCPTHAELSVGRGTESERSAHRVGGTIDA